MNTALPQPSVIGRGVYREGQPSRLHTLNILAGSTRTGKQVTLPLPRKSLASFVCLSAEPEDAKLTGATRSLSRRLLALNMRHDC